MSIADRKDAGSHAASWIYAYVGTGQVIAAGSGSASATRQQQGNSGHNYVREPRNRVGRRSPLYRAYRACLDYYTSRWGLELPRTHRIISVHARSPTVVRTY